MKLYCNVCSSLEMYYEIKYTMNQVCCDLKMERPWVQLCSSELFATESPALSLLFISHHCMCFITYNFQGCVTSCVSPIIVNLITHTKESPGVTVESPLSGIFPNSPEELFISVQCLWVWVCMYAQQCVPMPFSILTLGWNPTTFFLTNRAFCSPLSCKTSEVDHAVWVSRLL